MCDRGRRVPPAATATNPSDGEYQSALCGVEMTAGVHGAHFEMVELDGLGACVGVAGPGVDPATGRRAAASTSAEGWLVWSSNGDFCHGGRRSKWPGWPEGSELKEGDVIVRPAPSAASAASRGALTLLCPGPAARLRRGDPDGVGQRRAEGRHGPPRHDQHPRLPGGAAGGAAALGGGRVCFLCGQRRFGGHRWPLAAARVSRQATGLFPIAAAATQ